MAYGIHWQINFVALHTNDSYRVEILEDNYNDEIVHLRGASNPFETIEDNNEDSFTPIRKQTGSLRIADTGKDMDGNPFDYTDMLPDNTFGLMVRLWKEGTTDTLRWIGYIRPDSLTSKMFEKVSIREFKLICPLGTLYEVPVEFSNNQNNFGTVATIGQILHKALNSAGIAWDYVYKQNNVYKRNDLLTKVSLLNFIGNNNPTHSNPAAGNIDAFNATWRDESISWGSILEEVCKFWGWSLYSRGMNLYIVARNQRDPFTKFPFANLNNTTNSEMQDETPVSINFEDLSYASTNHTECRRLGYKNVTIESNVNDKEVVLDPDYEHAEMSYWPVAANPDQIIHISNEYLYALRRLGQQDGQQNTSQQFFDNYQVYENRVIATSSLIANFVICRYDGWDNKAFRTATEFNFKKGICNYMAVVPTAYDAPLTFFAKTLEDVCIPLNSVICINASASISYNPDPDWPSAGENDTLFEDANTAPPATRAQRSDESYYFKPDLENRMVLAALKIGDLWWDYENGVWSSTFKKFPLTFREDGSIVDPQNTFAGAGFNPQGILFDNHQGSKGFCIYVTNGTNAGAGLCGRLKLHIYASVTSNEDHLMLLNNGVLNELSVSIYNTDSKLAPKNKASHEFKGVASTRFRNNLGVNLKMASGANNVYGLGQLYNSDFSLLTTMTFLNESQQTSIMQPEARLLERMTQFYRDVSVQNTIEVLDDQEAELPSTIILKDENVKYHMQNVSHNWREGTMKLTLINN